MGVYSIDSSFFPDDSIDSSFFPDELIIKSVCRVLSRRIKRRVKEFGCLSDTVNRPMVLIPCMLLNRLEGAPLS